MAAPPLNTQSTLRSDGGDGVDVDPSLPLIRANSNQLTLLFQGEVYVFDSVTPEKVQAVLLLLGGSEIPNSSLTGIKAPDSYMNNEKGYEDVIRRNDISAKRVESLVRYQEKKKGRNFDKKIRYEVRKEVALSMQRNKGQFAGRANLEGESSTPNSDTPDLVLQDWKCQNCGIGQNMTPTLRRGPDGPRSLCNACGLNWANKGTLRNIKAKFPNRYPTYSFQQGQQEVHFEARNETNVMEEDMQQEIDEALKN